MLKGSTATLWNRGGKESRMSARELAPGSSVGGFQIVRVLGRGGMGVVYEAAGPEGRRVAIKFILNHLADGHALDRFRREGLAAAKVAHEHVARIVTVGEHSGSPFMVFEFLTGGSLADRIKKTGPLPWREAATLGAQVARGLEAIHRAKLVHRDLKPENVLLDEEGRAKISDFGLARTVGRGSIELTKTGAMLGTPDFMAPEQADSAGTVDGRADLYALGATLFALLTGRPPFEGQGIELVLKHFRERPRRVRALAPLVPERLDAIVLRLLAKSPEDRGTAAETAGELEAIAGMPNPGARSRLAPKLGSGLAVSLAALAGVAWLESRASRVEPAPPPTPASPTPPAISRPASSPPTPSLESELAPVGTRAGPTALALARLSRGLLLERVYADPGDGHRAAVTGVAFLESGALVSTSSDRSLIEWDPATRRPLERVVASRAGILSLALSPSRTRALTGSEDGAVALWDVGSRRVIAHLGSHSGPVDVVRFLSEAVGISGGRDGTARLWDLSGGKGLETLAVLGSVSIVATMPDGSFLVGGPDGRVRRGRPGGAALTLVFEAQHALGGLDVSADGKFAVTGDWDNLSFTVWDLESGQPRRSIRVPVLPNGHRPFVQDVLFVNDSSHVLAAESEGFVRLWDVAREEVVRSFEGPPSWVKTLALSADRRSFAAGHRDGSVRAWDLGDGERATVFEGTGSVTSLDVAADGRSLLEGTRDGRVVEWQAETGEEVFSAETYDAVVSYVAIVPGRSRILAAYGGEVRIFDPPERNNILLLASVASEITGLGFLGNGFVVTTERSGALSVWDPEETRTSTADSTGSPDPRWKTSLDGGANALAVLPNGRTVAVAGDDRVAFVDTTAKRVAAMPDATKEGPFCLAPASLTEDRALVGHWTGALALWSSAGPTKALPAQERRVLAVATDAETRRLAASASEDGLVRIWDLARAVEVERVDLSGLDDEALSLVFASRRGATTLFVGTERGAVLALGVARERRP
jgi:serine/threonine protein kinase/WD40 repeat protein